MIKISDSVILYSTDCPKCMVLKSKLAEKNVTYTENNSIEKMLGLGIYEVPVLCVNDTYLDFRDAVKWINNLKEN